MAYSRQASMKKTYFYPSFLRPNQTQQALELSVEMIFEGASSNECSLLKQCISVLHNF